MTKSVAMVTTLPFVVYFDTEYENFNVEESSKFITRSCLNETLIVEKQ